MKPGQSRQMQEVEVCNFVQECKNTWMNKVDALLYWVYVSNIISTMKIAPCKQTMYGSLPCAKVNDNLKH